MELFGLWGLKVWGPSRAQSLQKAMTHTAPGRRGMGWSDKRSLTQSHPKFLHYPVLQIGWPRSHDQKRRILAKGWTWFCTDSVEGLEHRHSTQEPVRWKDYGLKSLVQASWRAYDCQRWIRQKIGSNKASVLEKVGFYMQLWLSQELDLSRVCCGLWQPVLRMPRQFYGQSISTLADRRHTHN